MSEFTMPALVQTEEQKAYCAAKIAEYAALEKQKTKATEKLLGAALGVASESKIQIKNTTPETRIHKISNFANAHGLKVCVGKFDGLTTDASSDADKRLEQIVLGFAWAEHISQDEISEFEKASQS